jgi:hypothetical protein
MIRKISIAVACGVAAIAAIVIYFAYSAHQSALELQRQLDVMATIAPHSEFRIYRIRPDRHGLDDGNPYPRKDALAVIDALIVNAKRWEPYTDDPEMSCILPPPNATELIWCKDIKDREQRKKCSVTICYGNNLFWYGNNTYEISKEGREVLDRMFPENR